MSIASRSKLAQISINYTLRAAQQTFGKQGYKNIPSKQQPDLDLDRIVVLYINTLCTWNIATFGQTLEDKSQSPSPFKVQREVRRLVWIFLYTNKASRVEQPTHKSFLFFLKSPMTLMQRFCIATRFWLPLFAGHYAMHSSIPSCSMSRLLLSPTLF